MSLKLEEQVGELLKAMSLTLAVAESCTGGLLSDLLTDVPGSSEYFLGGVVAYQNDLKTMLLGVPAALIKEHGAVSSECALSMARGVQSATGADIAISITGIAGPGSGSPEKPVGTVYIGLVGPDFERVEHFRWNGDRRSNKKRSVEAALEMLVEYLSQPNAGLAPGLVEAQLDPIRAMQG